MGRQQPAATDTPTDVELACVDCSAGFIWTAGEQAFFAERDLQPPKRCRQCRDEKRRRNQAREKL